MTLRAITGQAPDFSGNRDLSGKAECEDEWQAIGMDDKQLQGAVTRILGPLYRQKLTEDKGG